MSKELEKIKAYVQKQTADMAENAKIELPDALAWWRARKPGASISRARTQKIMNNAEPV